MFSTRWRKTRGVLAEDTVAACLTHADRIWQGVMDNLPLDSVERNYGLVRRVNFISRDILAIVHSNNIWDLAEKNAGSSLRLCSLCISMRDEHTLNHPPHIDGQHTGVEGSKCLTMIIALSSISSKNGGTFFVLSNGRSVTPTLRPGDALMWHGDSIHSAGAVPPGGYRKALIARWIVQDQLDNLKQPYRPTMDKYGQIYG